MPLTTFIIEWENNETNHTESTVPGTSFQDALHTFELTIRTSIMGGLFSESFDYKIHSIRDAATPKRVG